MSSGTTQSWTFSSTSASSDKTTDLLPLNLSNLSLVGRSDEVAVLQRAYDRTRQKSHPSEVVLVHGASGSGKSALAQGLEKACEEEAKGDGFFVSGKFGQFENDLRPYSAVVDAVTELCHLIRSSEHQEEIRRTMEDNLTSDEIRILSKLMPSLRLLVGNCYRETKECSDSQVTNEHAFQRFKFLFRSFLAAVCAHSHLVLFLDDLQWADEASKQLIASLASDLNSVNTLLVIAFRDEDNYRYLPDDNTLAVSEISLGPLSMDAVNDMVATVIERRPQETASLSSIAHRKTGGNPYFVIQYLEMLHRRGLLGFSFATNKWEWDAEAIATTTDVSDNVLALLMDKISELSSSVQVVLMVAACLGFTFNVGVLEDTLMTKHFFQALTMHLDLKSENTCQGIVHSGETIEDGSKQIDRALKNATQAGLIEVLSLGKYKFSHDRVQQSVFAMFPKGDAGDRLQVQLGEILLEMSRTHSTEEWMLFTSVNLLTKRSDHCTLTAEELARLCLETAHNASRKSAFISAATYADRGLDCLLSGSTNRWSKHYDLSLELCSYSAVMHYSYGNFEKSSESISEVLNHACCLQDRLRAYSVRVAILGACQDWTGAIKEGAAVLKRLGVWQPVKANDRQVRRAVAETKHMLRGRKAADLRGLPPMTDNIVIEAMRLLATLTIYDWHAGEEHLLILHSLTMLRLTLEHGMGSFSPYGISAFGVLLGDFGELEESFEYAALALDLVRDPKFREGYPHAVKVVHLFSHHLKRPIHESLDGMLKAYTIAKETGNVELAGYCLQGHGMLSVVVGMPLTSLEKELKGYCDFCREFRQEATLMELLPFFQLTLNLMGKCENPLKLSGIGMVERDFVDNLVCLNEGSSSLLLLAYARMVLFYLLDELELAELERKKVDPRNDFFSTFFMKYLNYFFCGMTCLGLARKKTPCLHRWRARWYIRQVKIIAEAGSPNFLPMLKLLEAEKQALKDRSGTVLSEFDSAIAMASRCGFRLIKAIACERAGSYMLECGDASTAADYLDRARMEFSEHGAQAKIDQMEQKYGSHMHVAGTEEVAPSTYSPRLKPHLVEHWKQEL